MKPAKLKEGDLVQLHPTKTFEPKFAGCFLVVMELFDGGVIGYVQTPGNEVRAGGQAFYRAAWQEVAHVGKAKWITD